MRIFHNTLSAFAATLLLTALPATAATFLTEQQLLATFPGHTVNSKTDKGVSWAQAYGKGKKTGAIAGKFDGKDYKATWFVRNGMWCENWGDGEACWQVEDAGKGKYRMYKDGKPRPNLWAVK